MGVWNSRAKIGGGHIHGEAICTYNVRIYTQSKDQKWGAGAYKEIGTYSGNYRYTTFN